MSAVRVRLTSACFAATGLLFVLYPAIRPFSDEKSLRGAAAFGSTAWIVSHSLAIVAFVLLGLGLLGLYLRLQPTAVERLTLVGVVTSWIGIGLTLPFYGAEVFGLHAIGKAALKHNNVALVSIAGDVRGEPGIWFIIIGLILLAAGIIVFAVAIWRSGVLRKWIGIPLAAGFALYIPQYTAQQPLRVAHGLHDHCRMWTDRVEPRHFALLVLAAAVLVACDQPFQGARTSLQLSSAAFKNGGVIPAKYTCSGQDVSPPLNWSGVPSGARNLALTLIDPDAPGQPFVHWIIFNLPGQTVGLAEGEVHTGSRQGRNDFGSIGYRGPCPPRGAPHHYHFKLYALSDPLLLADGVSEADFEQAIKGMALDTTELVGTFGR